MWSVAFDMSAHWHTFINHRIMLHNMMVLNPGGSRRRTCVHSCWRTVERIDLKSSFLPARSGTHSAHFDIVATASVFPHNERVSFLLRNSFQYKTAIKLGRDLLEKEGCSRKEMVFDSLKDAPSLQVRQHPKSQQSSHQPCVILWHLIFKYSHLTKPQRSYKMAHLFIVVVYDSFNRKKRQNFHNLLFSGF